MENSNPSQNETLVNSDKTPIKIGNDDDDGKIGKFIRWKPKYAFMSDKTDYSERGFM